MSKLGKIQMGCLRGLRDSGVYPGRWVWDTHAHTSSVLDSLVRRGLAETYQVQSRYRPEETITHYRITDTGRAAL